MVDCTSTGAVSQIVNQCQQTSDSSVQLTSISHYVIQQLTLVVLKIGTPNNGHPGCPLSCIPMPIFTVNMGIPSTTTEGAPAAEGLPEETNAIGDSEKNDRDRSTLTTGNSLRVLSSRRSFPGKIWMLTNQIGATLARAHAYRQLRPRAIQASRGI